MTLANVVTMKPDGVRQKPWRMEAEAGVFVVEFIVFHGADRVWLPMSSAEARDVAAMLIKEADCLDGKVTP